MSRLAGNQFGHGDGFVFGLVRQHGAFAAIADGINARHIGFVMRVGDDAAAFVQRNAHLVQAQTVGIGPPSDGDQHDIGFDHGLVAARGGLDRDGQAGLLFLHARNLGGKLEGNALLGEDALKRFGDFQVDSRRDAVEEFDHRHIAAQTFPDRTQFQSDHARADDQKPLGHLFQRDGTGGGNDLLFVDGHTRQRRDVGAGGDDDVLGGEAAQRAVLALYFHLTRSGDAGFADNRFGFVLAKKKLDALGELAHHLVLLRHHRRQIEFDLRLDADTGEIAMRFMEAFAGMQQRLGRDAADIEAGAAECAALVDARRREAKLAQPDRGIVAAGTATDNDCVETVSHDDTPIWG